LQAHVPVWSFLRDLVAEFSEALGRKGAVGLSQRNTALNPGMVGYSDAWRDARSDHLLKTVAFPHATRP